MTIETQADPEASFSGFETYSWMPNPRGVDRRVGPQVAAWIIEAIDEQLTAKGFAKLDTGDTDFKVGYHAAVQGTMEVSYIDSYYGYGVQPWYPRFGAVEQQQSAARYYDQGSIVIDIVDARSNRLVWRGVAEAEVDRQADQEKRQPRIQEAVRKILADFPPN
jgi:hypothetical protein